jgi:hypothetical protein
MALPSVKRPKSGNPHNSQLRNFRGCRRIILESGASHSSRDYLLTPKVEDALAEALLRSLSLAFLLCSSALLAQAMPPLGAEGTSPVNFELLR